MKNLQTNLQVVPVILCGGAGTRLWPMSRELYPKQFLSLVDDMSLLQNTLKRVAKYKNIVSPLVVCNEDHRFLVAQQIHELDISPRSIMLEPIARNTAPAITIAALKLLNQGADQIMAVFPSDHVITDETTFLDGLEKAAALARKGYLVTFGVTPGSPEIGYGYMEKGKSIETGYQVKAFVEKPDVETARKYLDSGDYYWNSGMFVFTAKNYVEELEKHRPDILSACRKAIEGESEDADFSRVDGNAFKECPSDSIDYAVMEKTKRSAMVVLDVGWSDVGSWGSLWEIQDKTPENNVTKGDVIVEGVTNSYLHAEHRLISVVGLDNLVVVETADAVMIAARERSQEVKQIVQQLRSCDREERMTHRKVFRPWGYYESLDMGEKFQVKRICVNPGASLSLQMHHHRAEHWVVVAGVARVTNGDTEFLLQENESTYIPIETKHRLENPGEIPLEIIEIQSGDYLGEDDIVRFEDNYGRSE